MKESQIIVKLNGGLGNQMFQWALARMIEERMDIKTFLDMSYFKTGYARPYQLDIFNFKPQFVKGEFEYFKLDVIWTFRKYLNKKKFLGLSLYSEPHFHVDKEINLLTPNTYLEGFFQSEKYFKCVESQLREDFKFSAPLNDENRRTIAKIKDTNSVSVHIRRGDYVKKKRYQNLYADCSLDYYRSGVEHIAKSHPDPTLFVFSDDIKWVKENFKMPYECVFVEHNTGKKSYEDMRLMSLCRHNIIANSSFSWWGAWLNNNQEKIVIAPKRWFNDEEIIQSDVIPDEWIRIEN